MTGVNEERARQAMQVVLARLFKQGGEHGYIDVVDELRKEFEKAGVSPVVREGRVTGYTRGPLLRSRG